MMKYVKSIKWLFYFLFASILILRSDFLAAERPIAIVIPSYNNEKWYLKNLDSILHQHYGNYRIIYVNDCSGDGTAALVEEHLKELNIDYRVINFDPIPSDIRGMVASFCEES